MSTTHSPPGFAARRPTLAIAAGAGERLSFIDRAQTVAVFYVAAWAISPPLFADQWARWIAAAAVGVWLLGELTRVNGVILRPGPRVLTTFAFLAYTNGVSAYVDGVESLVSNIQLSVFLLFLIFFESARRIGLLKYRWVLWGLLLTLPVWIITTLSALATDRFAARLGTRVSDEALSYAASGVGGYGLVYMVLLTVPALLYLMWNLPPLPVRRAASAKSFWGIARKLLVIVTALFAVLLIVRAGFSIALTSLALAVVTFFLLSGREANRSFRMGLAIIIAIIAVAVSQTTLIGSVLDTAIELTNGTTYNAKLEDIRATMEADTSVGTVYDRVERYTRSLTLFFENPLTGTLSFRDVGKHSVILDTFAQFGVFVGVAFIYVTFSTGVMLLRAAKTRPAMVAPTAAFLVTLAICTLLNDVSASMGVAVFILLPLAMTYSRDQAPGGRWRGARRQRPPRPAAKALGPTG